jgi:hypothetical protein
VAFATTPTLPPQVTANFAAVLLTSHEDAILFCAQFPVHSPCTITGDMPDLQCDDPIDPPAKLSDPATVTGQLF